VGGLPPVSQLELNGIIKRYGGITALDGIDLTVEEGEFFCLLGPSAAGKTTSLRVIAGLERADAGRVAFAGRDLLDAPVQGRGMAMIFQTFALYPHLSTFDNLAYPLRETGERSDAIRGRVEDIAELLRISHALARKPGTLSGGEQQRLAIGRAIIRRPKLLLLDEPLTNLDAKLRHDMRAEFKRLHRELGMTMVYATPDQLEALTMGERIAVIKAGRIVQVATPDGLYDTPSTAWVAGMVGAPPINLVPGKVHGSDGGTRLALPFVEMDAARWADLLADDQSVSCGLRPHDLRPVDADYRSSFNAKVHMIEPLGDVTILDLAVNDATLRMVLPEAEANRYRTGDQLRVGFNPERALLFDAASGALVA